MFPVLESLFNKVAGLQACVPGNIARGLTSDGACVVGVRWLRVTFRYRSKKQLLLHILFGYVKNLPKELNSHVIRIGKSWRKKRCHFQIALLQLLRLSGFWFFAMVFASPTRLSLFTNKATIYLGQGKYRKISVPRHGLLSQWKSSISCTNLFVMATGQ